MRTALAGLVLLALALPAQAQGGLYKWVDEKGAVHYSDTPPAGKRTEQLKIAPPPSGNAAPGSGSRSWQDQIQESNERRHRENQQHLVRQQQQREAEEKCLRARRALDSLKREIPLYRVSPGGERVYMEDAERSALIADWQQQANANCR